MKCRLHTGFYDQKWQQINETVKSCMSNYEKIHIAFIKILKITRLLYEISKYMVKNVSDEDPIKQRDRCDQMKKIQNTTTLVDLPPPPPFSLSV